MVTDCAATNVPGPGEKIGAVARCSMVYVAEETALAASEEDFAMALIVWVLVTLNGALYACVEPPADAVGVLPSMV